MLLSTTGAMEALLHMKPVFTGNLRVQFFLCTLVCIISYHLFSFRGSAQDYKIHMDMEIVKFT